MNKTLLEEARDAARGVFALALGDRGAAAYFNFTQVGVVGSFIAFIAIAALNLAAALTTGEHGIFASAVQFSIIYAGFFGATALYLRRIGRTDAWIPFVVSSNWTDVFLGILTAVFGILGLDLLTILTGVAALVIAINAARLIMTLKPAQILFMFASQLVGVMLAVAVIIVVFPASVASAT